MKRNDLMLQKIDYTSTPLPHHLTASFFIVTATVLGSLLLSGGRVTAGIFFKDISRYMCARQYWCCLMLVGRFHG